MVKGVLEVMSRAIAPSHVAMNGYLPGAQASQACQTVSTLSGVQLARSKYIKQLAKDDSLTAQHSSLCAVNERSMDDVQPTGQAPNACKQPTAELSHVKKERLHVRFIWSLSLPLTVFIPSRGSPATRLTLFISVCMTSLVPTFLMHVLSRST